MRQRFSDRASSGPTIESLHAAFEHEIRTPLATLHNAVQLLGMAAAERPELERVHGIVSRQVERMNDLLDGFADLSRLLQGDSTPEPEAVDLVAEWRAVADRFGDRLRERGLVLHEDWPDDGRLIVAGERAALGELATQLLSNAVRFSDRGGSIRIALRSRAAVAELIVADDGIGIAAEFLPQAFDPFRCADRQRARDERARGIGLTLVAAVVRRHGGSIRLDSEGRGRGTTVTVCLPTAQGRALPG